MYTNDLIVLPKNTDMYTNDLIELPKNTDMYKPMT